METLKNFCPVKCEMNDLLSMAVSLKAFSINEESIINSGDELEALPNLQLLSSVRLKIAMKAIDKNPAILSSVPYFIKLWLIGERGEENRNLENSIAMGIQVFPVRLTLLSIEGCPLQRNAILQLENLPRLQALLLLNVDTGKQLTFSAGSFPCLNTLRIWNCDLAEWVIGDGALPNLQGLSLRHCSTLKKLPEGLPDSVDIECYDPCITGIENYDTCPHFNPSEASACT